MDLDYKMISNIKDKISSAEYKILSNIKDIQ